MSVELSSAIAISLRVALIATLVATPCALGLGWVLARRPFPGRAALAIALAIPMVLPPVVTGYLLLELFGRGGPLGGLGVAFTFAGAAVAGSG